MVYNKFLKKILYIFLFKEWLIMNFRIFYGMRSFLNVFLDVYFCDN